MEKESNRKKIIVIIVVIVLVLALSILLFCLFTIPTLELKGENNVTLIYPNNYQENGYQAKTLVKDITKNVQIKGKVDSTKIGIYKITYKIKNLLFDDSKTRTVKVVDNEKPVITLKGDKEPKVCPKKEYKEEGYEATDNYDKDLSEKVVVTNNKDELVYTVQDTSGNEAKVIRKIKYEDKTKPKISLSGGSKISLYVGSTYKEPGYKVTDNCDSNLTKSVKVTGSVNTKKVGTYTLTYTVKDTAGNEAKTTRKVVVSYKPASNSLVNATSSCGTKGVIYLTFDDGPASGSTTKILNILKQEGVKATFFVTNSGPDSLIKREFNEGHTVALHTASHTYSKVYASVDAYFSDLNKVSDRVKRLTGTTSKIIRFPGGSSNTVSRHYSKGIMTTLSKEVVNRGYKYYDWNVDSDDAGKCRTSSCVYNNVVSLLSKNKCNMVLMHDVKSYTANALQDIIKYGKSHGYSFQKITSSTPMVRHGINN